MAGQIADTRTLQLQINASTELLIRNLKQADQAVAAFQQTSDNRLTAIDRSFARVGSGASGLLAGLAAAVSVGSLVSLAKQGLEYASSLDEVSQQVGVTARDLQVLRYAGSQVGISTEEMDKALTKFTKSLGEARAGSAASIGVFKQLGFSDSDIKKLDAHEVLLKTADGISQIKDATLQAAPATALFGKAGQKLLTLLSTGSAGINNLALAAERLGIVLSHEQIENADAAADKLSELKQVLEANIAGFVADNAKAIYDFAEALEHLTLEAADFVRDAKVNFQGLGALFDPLVTAGESAFDKLGIRVTSFHDQIVSVLQGIDQLRNIPIDLNNKAASFDQKYLSGLPGYKPGQTVGRSDLAGDFDKNYSKARLKDFLARNTTVDTGEGDAKPVGGNRTYHDPAAVAAAAKAAIDAARKAEAERVKDVGRQKRVADESARLDDTYLGSRAQITQDAAEQARIERERLSNDTAAKLADVDAQVASKQATEAEAKALRARIQRNAGAEADAINQRENVELERAANDLASARLDDLRDIAGSDASLATTARERRDIALRVLAAEKEDERRRLKEIADDAARPVSERRHSQGEIDVAQQGLSTINDRYAGREATARQGTAGPLESYKDQLQRAVGDTNEALQGLQVDAFHGLEDGLLGVIDGTESVASAFKKMATSIIADLLRIGVEQTILGALGGSAGGTGLLSGLGKLFGGGKASGGAIDSGKFYVVGENGPELFAPGASGSIIPNHALRAPTIGSLAGSGGRGGEVTHRVVVEPNANFDVRVATTATGVVFGAAPAIVDSAKGKTLQALSRGRLPGGLTG